MPMSCDCLFLTTIHRPANCNSNTKPKHSQRVCAELVTIRMWADAQRDGRPAYYRWRPLFNAAVFG